MEVMLSDQEAAAFRARCRAFLVEHAVDVGPVEEESLSTFERAKRFQRALASAGLAGLAYDSAFGGAGLTKAHDRIWREEYAGFPEVTAELIITHGMCLPVLDQFGTTEQKSRFMPRNISCEEIWCQMFSEPGAGSDVASLQTRAERDGDEWVLNGQKVWTTFAHLCDYGVIIARTDPDVPKHAGISMFIMDMRAPGVEMRPIHQIDGGSHFNEIFLTDVRIPENWLLGELNNGWNQATAMLMYERVAIGTGATSGVTHPTADRLIAEAVRLDRVCDPVVRQELMRVYSEETVKSLVSMRTRAELESGRAPGPGGSLGKLHGSRIAWMVRPFLNRLLGPGGDAWELGDRAAEAWGQQIMGSFMGSIAGGTDEIQRNIIGDRILGLPREPALDKDVAFKDLRVGTQR